MNSATQTFENAFVEFLTRQRLILKHERVLLAASGGIDSMVLLQLLYGVRDDMGLDLQLIHVNHRLRGEESDGDEEFLRGRAQQLSIPIHVRSVETALFSSQNGYSIQEGARVLRYRAFEEIRSQIGAHRIATAHQYDDNAETVLINILRGSGLRGLSGIPVSRDDGKIIRPLLFARRSEIEAFAEEQEIAFRVDSSNASSHYLRNVIRQSIIPVLQQESQMDVVGTLNKIAEFTGNVRQRVQQETDSVYDRIVTPGAEGNIELNIPSFLNLDNYLQDEVLRRVLEQIELEPSLEHLDAIRTLCAQITGRSISLSKDRYVIRDRDSLWFRTRSERPEYRFELEIGQEVTTDDFRFSSVLIDTVPKKFGPDRNHESVDSEILGTRFTLRNWTPGDWFIPLGMSSKKKLSDFFIDEKVPVFKKNRIPVLESHGEIVWVCGMRLDDRFKITSKTRTVAQLNYTPLKQDH